MKSTFNKLLNIQINVFQNSLCSLPTSISEAWHLLDQTMQRLPLTRGLGWVVQGPSMVFHHSSIMWCPQVWLPIWKGTCCPEEESFHYSGEAGPRGAQAVNLQVKIAWKPRPHWRHKLSAFPRQDELADPAKDENK